MSELIDFVLHFQDHLHEFTRANGPLVYLLLFGIVFCETGLVATPFLPGDSLLFAVGAIAGDPLSGMNVWIASGTLFAAAVLGDTANYWIGRKFGRWAMRRFPRIVRPDHLRRTSVFFAHHGGKTILMARFVPIVRTFAPFVAGSGEMDYCRFMVFNVGGAFVWVGSLVTAGWFFGRLPFVKENFEIVVLGIVILSMVPMLHRFLQSRLKDHTGSQIPRPHLAASVPVTPGPPRPAADDLPAEEALSSPSGKLVPPSRAGR